MASIFDEAMADGDMFEEARASVEHLRENCPLLADLLGGTKGKAGVVDRSPGSVRLFSNGGVLKMEISGIEWTRVGYLVVPKEIKHFSHTEALLESAKISWSKKRERKDSKTDAPF